MKKILIASIICVLLISTPLIAATPPEQTGAALELEIFGGFRTGVKIRNIGDDDALLVGYNITIQGGIINPININLTGILGSLPPHNGVVDLVITFPPEQIRGLGQVTINAEADSLFTSPIQKQATGFLLFFFVLLQQ